MKQSTPKHAGVRIRATVLRSLAITTLAILVALPTRAGVLLHYDFENVDLINNVVPDLSGNNYYGHFADDYVVGTGGVSVISDGVDGNKALHVDLTDHVKKQLLIGPNVGGIRYWAALESALASNPEGAFDLYLRHDDHVPNGGIQEIMLKRAANMTLSRLHREFASPPEGGAPTRYVATIGSTTLQAPGALFTANEWHRLSMSWGGGGLRLYVDEQLVDSAPYTGTIYGGTAYWMSVFSQRANSNLGTFDIDEVYLYDTATFAAFTIPEPSLVGLWLLGGGALALYRRCRK